MTIESTLSKEAYIKLSTALHFNQLYFHVFLVVAGLVTAYALTTGNYPLAIIAWIPTVSHVGLGLFTIYRTASNQENPHFLPTRYKFDETGVMVGTSKGQAKLKWADIVRWGKIADCYVLFLEEGSLFAIPRKAILHHHVAQFEQMLQEKIMKQQRGGS
jgi:hypothetical protein